jgi:hypothetical protein
LILLNACRAGLVGCEQFSSALGVAALGWPGLVSDDAAADFTFYYYQRLMEGLTAVAAVHSFAQAVWNRQTLLEFPVLWLPSPAWVDWRPLGPEATTDPVPVENGGVSEWLVSDSGGGDGGGRLGGGADRGITPGETSGMTVPDARATGIRMEFRPRAVINPALLVNGLQPIEHISIDSPEEQTVHLFLTCDIGGKLSMYRLTVPLKNGTNHIVTKEIHFPALHELIERHARRRHVSFTATILDTNNKELYGETRMASWTGAEEWLDQEDTWAFVPAFVNPFDVGVVKVVEAATRVLRTLGEPRDAFSGYAAPPNPAQINTYMRAIYQTLRDDAGGITYISPPGSPLFDGKSRRPIGQVVRTHGEVVERRLGTCHDLALLLGACAEYVGIRPLIALMTGHTIVGYWTDKAHQEGYWKARGNRLRTGKVGENWIMENGAEFLGLVKSNKIVLIESTFLRHKEKTFDEACGAYAARLNEETMEVAVDIYAARQNIQPV